MRARASPRLPPSALLALGKFGGRELGFASDLEVLLVHDERRPPCDRHGHARRHLLRRGGGGPAGRRSAAGRAIPSTSISGSGPTAAPAPRPTSLATFLDYYRAGGPAWGYERQALIKLRVIAGDPRWGVSWRPTATGTSTVPSRST